MSWLPSTFAHPRRVELLSGHHLRPIRADDVDIDYPAVMGSRERLWSIYGEPWGWPLATMTVDQDRADLARHEAEAEAQVSFNYALLNGTETKLLGCVYIDPPERQAADAEISWWVIDALVGTDLEAELDELLPRWIEQEWPFARPRYPGREMSWETWLALPPIGA